MPFFEKSCICFLTARNLNQKKWDIGHWESYQFIDDDNNDNYLKHEAPFLNFPIFELNDNDLLKLHQTFWIPAQILAEWEKLREICCFNYARLKSTN